MSDLQELLQHRVDEGMVPGAVALVATRGGTEVAVAGHLDLSGTEAMCRDTIFRIASVTKPMTAAVVMMLVEDGRIRLDDPVSRWLPEIADPVVVRTRGSAADDVVPVARAVTVEDLLTMRAGWGWASDFDLPAVAVLADRIERQGDPHEPRTPEQWLRDLATVPMLHQPGTAWLYNTCADLQGVLISRVLDQPLAAAFEERLTGPLGLRDTGFVVPAAQRRRLADVYRATQDGRLTTVDEPDGSYADPPGFFSGAGGLVSTVDDLHRFARLLLAGGELDGVRLLRPGTVAAMTTDHLNREQREGGRLFLEGQGWGYGGSVDLEPGDPWVVPGRYGWIGGTGTAWYIVPSTGAVSVLLTQRQLGGPDDTVLLQEFCTYAARS